MSATSYKFGAYQASEGHLEHRGRLSKPGVDKLLVVCHGRSPGVTVGQSCLQWVQAAAGGPPHLLYLAERGYAVMAIDAGGPLTWGNAASVTALTNAITYGKANFANPNMKVGLVGYSMGNLVVLNYLRSAGQSGVAGIVLEACPYDLDWYNANGYSSELSTAYPSGYTVSNPKNFISSITVPAQIFACRDDATVPYTDDQSILAGLGSPNKQLTSVATGGHAPWSAVDAAALLYWFNGLPW